MTLGGIRSAKNCYLDRLINSVVRCSRVQIVVLKVHAHNSTNSTDRWAPPWLQSVKWLLQWDTITRLTGSCAACVAKPAVHLQPELGPHQRIMKPHSHRYFRMPFSLFWVQIYTLANHPNSIYGEVPLSPEVSLGTACLGSAIMQCQVCSVSNLCQHISGKGTN